MALTTPTHIRHGSNIGQPMTRREGVLKVTGSAQYAADNHPPGMLHAAMAVSSIARGRVASLDIEAARAHRGVVEVMTPANVPPLATHPDTKNSPFDFRIDTLQDDGVRYANQPIAIVIADTLEAATEGAMLLAPTYVTEPVDVSLGQGAHYVPPAVGVGSPALESHGDIARGLASAVRRIEAVYETPAQYHNPIEPHAIVAHWDGDRLTLDTPSQGMAMAQMRLSALLGIAPDKILIRSPFLGGGFGCKGFIHGPQVLGILAARLVGRPVKLVLRREQMFGPVTHRAPTRQRIRLGAASDGALTALDHYTLTATSRFDDFYEPSGNVSHTLYAAAAIATSYEAVRLDTGTPLFMRAPGEASGSAALEGAIDEMAEACGMDPLEFRLKNYADAEPISGKPFSSKALRECYAQGAMRFGWAGRPLAPRSMQDARGLLTGWGVGTATFPALMFHAKARAEIRADGAAVEIGAHIREPIGRGHSCRLCSGDAGAIPLRNLSPENIAELHSGRGRARDFRIIEALQLPPDCGCHGGALAGAVATSHRDAGFGLCDRIEKLRLLPCWIQTEPLLRVKNGAQTPQGAQLGIFDCPVYRYIHIHVASHSERVAHKLIACGGGHLQRAIVHGVSRERKRDPGIRLQEPDDAAGVVYVGSQVRHNDGHHSERAGAVARVARRAVVLRLSKVGLHPLRTFTGHA